MDDLKTRIKMLLEEVENIHLKKTWPEHLIGIGVSEDDARVWAAEIGHVVEEYQSSLIRLVDLLQESNLEYIPEKVYSWAVGRVEVTIPEIEEPMRYLQGILQKYIPPEPDDEEDPS